MSLATHKRILSRVYWLPRHSIKMMLRLEGSYAGVSLQCNFCVVSGSDFSRQGRSNDLPHGYSLQYHLVRYARQTWTHFLLPLHECMYSRVVTLANKPVLFYVSRQINRKHHQRSSEQKNAVCLLLDCIIACTKTHRSEFFLVSHNILTIR